MKVKKLMDSVKIEYNVPVPMRDGVILQADVYRPEGDGPWPVIVARTPYDKGEVPELLFLDPWLAARRGFIAVVQDVRGRFKSEGDFRPFMAEAPDGEDTIAWAASLSGASGAVGMWGLSYLGNVQWQAAGRQPSALKAIVPSFTFRETADGLGARGGANEVGLVRSWGVFMGFDQVIRRHGHNSNELDKHIRMLAEASDGIPGPTYWELPTQPDAVITRYELPNLSGPDSRAVADVPPHQEKVTVPSLHIGGWYDVFIQGTIDNYCAAAEKTPATLVIGPWSHTVMTAQQGDINFGFAGNGSALDYTTSILELTFDWLHSWLTDGKAPNDELPVKIYVMGANEWRSEAEWPLRRAIETPWFLGAGAALKAQADSTASSVTFSYDPQDPVPSVGGASFIVPSPSAGAIDQGQVEDREDVLVFTSDVLNDNVEVTGRVSATLSAQTDGRTTDWVVRLCDVHPNGRSYVVTDGITRVNGEPGETASVAVDLWSTSMLFKKGHRIRVQVTSSCFPRWDRNLNTADGLKTGKMRVANQIIHLGGGHQSFLTLPIVPAS
ncbi:CocE/NonD family hydrolase [Pseudarthrobacter sp. R1]|uniref:CocE/NonD family hydrolase n=1 Tax=Pseudarthrobacter sp. R1 TaxID=2944934 RepID=UPI00210A2AC6|nr:CocE/NonD family hydrolase [Pseudarthrobacter sp. R1]MCQ6272763.1 CocE/NonD family hydrolase [Pseudarthrobacter sp. R1]